MAKKILMCLFLTLLIAACSSDKEDNNIYGYTFQQKDQNRDDDVLNKSATKLINSEQEFKEFTHSETASGINFSKKTLLVVYGCNSTGVDKVTDNISRDGDKYMITVNVRCNFTLVLGPWAVAYIVPKLTNLNNVKAVVTYN